MNRRNRIICIFLAALMLFSLSGCMLLSSMGSIIADDLLISDYDLRNDIIPFTEIEYERPDITEISDKADEVCRLVDKGKVNNELIEAFEDFYGAYRHYLTMSTVAMIRSDADTSDGYYFAENQWCSEKSGEVDRVLDDLLRYCANSDISDELDEVYFEGYLAESYSEDASFEYTDEIVELIAEESRLVSDYDELATEMLYTDIDETDSWDDLNADAAEIYIRLIKVRRELAEECGYSSYIEMAYENFGRDYTPEDIEKYSAAIKKYISPLYRDALSDGSFYSAYNVGSMRPERSFRNVAKCLSALDPTLEECMVFMKKYELYDISDSLNKTSVSYTSYLYDYDSPYLFVCPDREKSDMLTIAHEFGHFCDEYLNYDGNYSLDTSEMLSQGMEYMFISRLEDDKLREELTAYKFADVLALYVDQGCYSEFEHLAYALDDDELTVDSLNALFADVADDYRFSLTYPSEYLNYIWIQIPHLFEYPFYVISYCVSDSAAFNLYMAELEDTGSGFSAYMDLLSDSDADDFLKLIDKHDLPSPISPRTVKNISEIIKDRLLSA